jgi:2-dehydropantoate 2-reductase
VKFAILGAGAIGGTIGAGLQRAGHDVVLVSRGETLEALRRGLRLQTPDSDEVLDIPVADTVPDCDVVILATKSQDTAAALASVDGEVAVACAQNGIANERMALRRFADVYGVYVRMPAQHIEPGVVQCYAWPVAGVLDVGRYPAGCDDTARALSAAFAGAGFSSRAVDDVMRLKRAKLLGNLVNAIDALTGEIPEEVYDAVRAEGLAVFEAAGLDFADEAEFAGRHSEPRAVGGVGHQGSSSWQSLKRGSGSIEADYLNGEIALLGRLHGVPTPFNARLQRLANQLARERSVPGSLPARRLLAD